MDEVDSFAAELLLEGMQRKRHEIVEQIAALRAILDGTTVPPELEELNAQEQAARARLERVRDPRATNIPEDLRNARAAQQRLEQSLRTAQARLEGIDNDPADLNLVRAAGLQSAPTPVTWGQLRHQIFRRIRTTRAEGEQDVDFANWLRTPAAQQVFDAEALQDIQEQAEVSTPDPVAVERLLTELGALLTTVRKARLAEIERRQHEVNRAYSELAVANDRVAGFDRRAQDEWEQLRQQKAARLQRVRDEIARLDHQREKAESRIAASERKLQEPNPSNQTGQGS